LAHISVDEARFKEETVLTRQYEAEKFNPEQMIALGYAQRIVPSDALREEIDGLLRQMIDARKDK
jgi:enoyl-CoA hydratase/carnithine racemase